jgi:hypothetical protein
VWRIGLSGVLVGHACGSRVMGGLIVEDASASL